MARALGRRGVTAPLGYLAGASAADIRGKGEARLDVAVLCSTLPAVPAAVYTTNRVQAAPLLVTRRHVATGLIRAVVINSGNANACTGPQGESDALAMARATAAALELPTEQVAVASTGVIGVPLPMERVLSGARQAAAHLSEDGGRTAAQAILTTDTFAKEATVRARVGGQEVTIGGMAKGSGMIHPNLATMLAFLTTDARVEPGAWQRALSTVVERTFNRITVDGDTSTNDMVLALANGAAGGPLLNEASPAWPDFVTALESTARSLARDIARDGEGATRLLEVVVRGGASEAEAARAARAVAGSSLVKAAVHGADPNWGRILAALGRSGLPLDPLRTSIWIGPVQVAARGQGLPFAEEEARRALLQDTATIIVDLGLGEAEATAFGCDLSARYVEINAAYRT